MKKIEKMTITEMEHWILWAKTEICEFEAFIKTIKAELKKRKK